MRAVRRYNEHAIAYAPSAGLPVVIEAWQRFFAAGGIRFNEQEIIITTDGSEALLFALLGVADPDDEILAFEPLYPNYISLARMAGVTLRAVNLRLDTAYQLPPLQQLQSLVTSKTKAVLVCNPNNPTGAVLSDRELTDLATLVRQHNLFLIADETYREIIFTNTRPRSFAAFGQIRDRVILVDSLSKRFNACGARIGCLASTNPEVMDAALRFAQGRLSAPTLEQVGAVPLLRHGRQLIKPIVREYKRRSRLVTDRLRTIPGVRLAEPGGALYVMMQLPVDDADRFCTWLLNDFSYHRQTVMPAPGSGFYVTPNLGRQEARLAYVLEPKLLARAVDILKRGLEQYADGA